MGCSAPMRTISGTTVTHIRSISGAPPVWTDATSLLCMRSH